jgi:hypothetical protein
MIHDHVTFTSHISMTPSNRNMIGEPHIILRPLTVSFSNEVDPGSRDRLEEKIREHHKNIMDPTDEAKSSNVALVEGQPYENSDGQDEVQAGYYKWPQSQHSDELIVDYGVRHVALT